MRLKEAYKLNREHSISKNISEFGAVPSNPDNTAAFAKAVVWLNEQTEPACLVFGPGIYSYETSPNWAVSYATITSCGVVRLRCTGTGDSFILSGGAASAWDMRVGPFYIEGHDGSGNGVLMDAIQHSKIDVNVRGCGTTQAGLRMQWCVVNKLDYVCSVNEPDSWYNDGTGVAKPKYGVYIDDDASARFTTYNLFLDPIIEGCEFGVHIEKGTGNQFNGGTIEGNTDWGVIVETGCNNNKFIGGDFEANTNGDIQVGGAETDIIGCDSDNLIQFVTNATGGGKHSKIIGGACDSITVDSTVVGVKIKSTSYNRTGSGVFTDNGNNTRIVDLTNITNQVIIKTPLIALSSYDAEPARAAEANIHGGLLSLATGQTLNSGSPVNVTKGIGKLLFVVNAGSDITGTLTITGTSVNRVTGAETGSDTDDIDIDALTTDTSDTDANSNVRHAFADAYISSKWFDGSIAITTADLTISDIDVYHVSFEQFNDIFSYRLKTLDMNVLTTNVNAEIDVYLYTIQVSGSKCDVGRQASLNVGAGGNTALANKYYRLRRGALNVDLVGSTDGLWVDAHYSNSPAYVEDSTIKVWAEY